MEDMRPLKRPKLGIPDVYPQEARQREDDLTIQTLNQGLRLGSAHSYETMSAKNDFSHARANDFTSRLNQIIDVKKRSSWGQDSQKKRSNLSRDNFWPVPVGRSKREQAVLWFQGLAGNETLEQLIKRKVPIFNKREEIFDVLFEKNVPALRAVWYIKMTAGHTSLGAEMKLTKKKQTADPSFEWTVSLTKFMQETVWRLSNESSRHDSVSGTRSSSISQSNEETLTELSRWKYITELSSWLYQENLLDCQEFLRWLIERIETSKPDEKSLVLYLPLALKYLMDISRCVYLARPLIQFCCQKFASLYETHQRVLQILSQKLPPTSLLGNKGEGTETMETNEDDDVFLNRGTGITIKQEPKTEDTPVRHVAGRKRSKSGSLTVTIEGPAISNCSANESGTTTERGCKHHSSLLLQLSCIVQILAIQCPTAFINVSLSSKGGRENVSKATTPLDKLPLKLSEMPLPRKVAEKKLESMLSMTEHEIRGRTKIADSGWSVATVSDLQTSNKGHIVIEVLKVLKELDRHSFVTCKSHSSLSTLYVKIVQTYKPNELLLQSTDPLCMLLCKWAITPHRSGLHRPFVAARLLKRLQNDKLQGSVTTDLEALDEFWEYPETSSTGEVPIFPFQQILFQFLDTRAALPESLYVRLKTNEPFKHLLTLFSELIFLRIFSYSLYISTLIARGDTKSTIVPLLPFFRGEGGNPPSSPVESELEELVLMTHIPLSILPKFKKTLLDVRQEAAGTLSPCLHSSFGSQDNFLATLEVLDSSTFVEDDPMKMEENPSLLQVRASKLKQLMFDSMEDAPSQLVSPVGFGSHASSPTKQDIFNFPLNFLDGPPSNQSLEDTLNIRGESSTLSISTNAKLDIKANKHLIYAAYFTLTPVEISRHNLKQRSVVLCGTGQSRAKVEETISKLYFKSDQLLKDLSKQSSPVFSEPVNDFLSDFELLPTFEQNYIATNCVRLILSRQFVANEVVYRGFPSCSQLVFVCEMLELAGSYHKLVQFLVELIAHEEERKDSRLHVHVPLSIPLCIPVVNMLWKYFSILLLSLHDTLVVYERLYKVLDDGVLKPFNFSASQKAIFLFLKHMQTHCYYVGRTYPTLPDYFEDYCVPVIEDMPLQQTSILPKLINACKESSIFAGGRPLESEQTINQIINICTTGKHSFYFVCEIFHIAVQKQTNIQTLTVLAHISAEVSCSIDILPKELLGALRALCIPGSAHKGCATGYLQLTQRSNIITTPHIQGNLITFIGLLLTFNCFKIQDIITYIVKPIFKVYLLYPQEPGNAQKGNLSLQFVSLLLCYLLVDTYICGEHDINNKDKSQHKVHYPPFVRHYLLAKSQQLSFDVVLNLLKDLLKLCKDTLRSSRGTTVSTGKSGMMSIIVESYSSGSEGNEQALVKLRETMEVIAKQGWVREKCSKQDSRQLLDPDKLGDASLSPPQAQYLLHLLIPYYTQDTTISSNDCGDGSLPSYMMYPDQTIDRILKNLDQWTLHNALLHLNLNINHHSTAQIDHLSQSVIQVFEDSCNSDDWVGNNDKVDGAYSPSIWLVTPLVSELPKSVLGRILKNAGNVLGRGQWWNIEKSQEKRRSTRATNTTTTPTSKTGLQWQQPFLELVLACMNSHPSNHEELLGPLQKQLNTFLLAFEKEGMPMDEQNRSILYTSLRLRLSLIGSMLTSVCVSESNILEWVSLLIQLICSGAVDRQPDNSELFTNCLDMLNALLQALSPDFHISVVSGGEEGKKSYIQCIKKMKLDLANSKSSCISEIHQLFPLPQKSYEVTIVKPPSFTQQFRPSDKVQGLRIQETKEISPWEIIEGTKGGGPFQLSWFGAMRMKRKPLTYFEQKRKVILHTHQQSYNRIASNRHYVYLPEIPSSENISTDPAQAQATTPMLPGEPTPATNIGQGGSGTNSMPPQRAKIQDVLEIIRRMNENPSSNVQGPPGPLPPNIRSTVQPNIGPPHQAGPAMLSAPPRQIHAAHMVPPATNQAILHGPSPARHMAPPSNNPQNWFEMMLRDLTPEQRNHFNTLPMDQKRTYFMNYKRKVELSRMVNTPAYRHPIHHRPMSVQPHMLGPPQRPMMHRGYPHPAQMVGPPAHHPGYMMAHHHPQMFRQPNAPMYGPRHPGPPIHYQ